ncbi:hypothetical protein INT44_004457 [Umbelopsis vinacea]|uniref:t-SNARE coiled-coil homology domain-containing protein n=1 Tax=Umbelopsis vinacea TaxID=44442 RepID=A0A8H7QCG7_9FUNG|nr:hypothetical protein INT44_004457 [Umbelopsis vinacea]KAI9284338.1 hypothetical protein BC943DRAFT_338282 [Umbelopsis sp. AD052]
MSDRKKLFGNIKGKGVSRDREEENALMLEQQNDFRMQELDAKVSALKNVTIDIHRDVTEQHDLIDESTNVFAGFGSAFNNSFGRLNRMVSTRHKRQLCLYVAIIVVAFFIFYYGFGSFWSSSETAPPVLDDSSPLHNDADIL